MGTKIETNDLDGNEKTVKWYSTWYYPHAHVPRIPTLRSIRIDNNSNITIGISNGYESQAMADFRRIGCLTFLDSQDDPFLEGVDSNSVPFLQNPGRQLGLGHPFGHGWVFQLDSCPSSVSVFDSVH